MEFTEDIMYASHWKTFIYFLPHEKKWAWGRDLFSEFSFNYYLDANMESHIKGLDMDSGTVPWMRRKIPQMYGWKRDLSKITFCSFDDEAYKSTF